MKKKVLKEEKKGSLTKWLTIFFIILLTFFTFYPSLSDDFTNWDDPFYVSGNPLVTSNNINVKDIFSKREWPAMNSYYHPLLILTYAIDYQRGALNPGVYHEFNLLLHLANTALVFLLVLMLSNGNVFIAAFVSLFFGIHPMHVESVVWVSGRKDLLYTFFFLLALITYIRHRKTGRYIIYVATLALFTLSCLSKVMAVIFPVIILLIDYYILNKKMELVKKIPFFLISVIVGLVALTNRAPDDSSFSFVQYLLFSAQNLVIYICKVFVPYPLSIVHPYPANMAVLYIYPLALALLVAAGIILLRKKKEISFGLLFYLTAILLVLTSRTESIIAERYTYLAYIGLLFALANIFYRLYNQKAGILSLAKYPLLAMVLLSAMLFSYQSYSRTRYVWKNSETLWTDAIQKYPNSAIAYNNRAILYASQGKLPEAESDFNNMVRYDSSYKAFHNRAVFYDKSGQKELAVKDYTECLTIKQTDSIYNYRGVINHQLGRYANAIDDFTNAIKINPAPGNYWMNRSFSENSSGDKEKARVDILMAIKNGQSVDKRYLEYLGINSY